MEILWNGGGIRIEPLFGDDLLCARSRTMWKRHMVSSPFDTDRQPIAIDFSDRPTLALLYALSGWLMNFLGPMFWAALIVAFLYAEMFTS